MAHDFVEGSDKFSDDFSRVHTSRLVSVEEIRRYDWSRHWTTRAWRVSVGVSLSALDHTLSTPKRKYKSTAFRMRKRLAVMHDASPSTVFLRVVVQTDIELEYLKDERL